MPLALAIWTTTEPTAPAAAETKTMSPSFACGGVEQPEIGGDAGHSEDAEEALGRSAEVGQLVAPCAPATTASSRQPPMCWTRSPGLSPRPCSRPLRRSRRRPAARRPGTAARSFSRRSSGRACRDRPRATGCGRAPGRRQAAEARSPSARNCRVGMPLGRLLRCQARAIVVSSCSTRAHRSCATRTRKTRR